MTIVEMLEGNARRFPGKTALIYKESKVSYKEFYEKSNALANFLVSIGLQKGETVGLLLRKTPEAIISFLGVSAAGGIVFPIDHYQTDADIQFTLNLTQPSVLIVEEDFQPLFSRLRFPTSDKQIIIIGKTSGNQYQSWEKIFSQGTVSSPNIAIREDDPVYLNFTSGTTGTPKAAICTHANIYWNTLSSVESLGLIPDDVHLCLFPVFVHPHELFARSLYLGGTSVLIDSISPKSISRAISHHKVTCMMAVASIYETLVRFQASEAFDFSSLRVPESGGMHVNPTLAKRLKARFGIPMIPVWGSTETTGIALANPIEGVHKESSMGSPCPYCEVKIVGEDGNELPPNKCSPPKKTFMETITCGILSWFAPFH